MEATDHQSSTSSQQPYLPPGFRFHPTDEELVVHYLKKKAASAPLPAANIAEVDLYKFDPWELPAKAAFGEQEWYFFSQRDRKYPNGARPNRAATSGYWKATGIDKPVLTAGGTQKVGVKKALVFYGGKPPKGVKTNWIMHEYRLTDGKSICSPPAYDPAKSKGSLRLDDWVLCRIYKKSNTPRPVEGDGQGGGDLTIASPLPCRSYNHHWFMKPTIGGTEYNSILDQDHEHNNLLLDNMLNSNTSNVNHHHNTFVNTSNLLPVKRSALSGLSWNEEVNPGNSSSSSAAAYTKMFLTDSNTDRSPMDTQADLPQLQLQLQLQLQQQQQQQTMMLAPGEGVFAQQYQLPEMKWYN